MPDLGAPSINLSFKEKSADAIVRGERGIVALMVEEAVIETRKNPITIVDATDIPTELSDATKDQIKLALIGYITKPKKVIVYCLGELEDDEESDTVETAYNAGLKAMEIVKFNYMVLPNVKTRNLTDNVVSWAKKMRENKKMIHVVLPITTGEHEAIINYATNSVTKTDIKTGLDGKITTSDTVYTAEQYCSRIAGLICGTPLQMSCTYAELPELTACEVQEDDSEAVNDGKLVLINDTEKIKLNRAVNSFVTITTTKGDSFKKIKIVEAMDMITDDITKTIQDAYIGKYPNSYANKQVLITAIKEYFKGLQSAEIVSNYDVGFDLAAIKSYLITIKGYTEDEIADMSEDDIKKSDTGSKVFLTANVNILDAIEDVDLPIHI